MYFLSSFVHIGIEGDAVDRYIDRTVSNTSGWGDRLAEFQVALVVNAVKTLDVCYTVDT
jgi:hypothetical protein